MNIRQVDIIMAMLHFTNRHGTMIAVPRDIQVVGERSGPTPSERGAFALNIKDDWEIKIGNHVVLSLKNQWHVTADKSALNALADE